MPRIDFYILQTQENEAYFAFICRLIEKAYLREHTLFVYCATEKELNQLDSLLWTFNDISFIPHKRAQQTQSLDLPVLLDTHSPPAHYQKLLINLSLEIPDFYKQFARVIEIIPNEENKKLSARQRYSHYRDHGCELETHKI